MTSRYVIAIRPWITRNYQLVRLSTPWKYLVHGYGERAMNHGVIKLKYITHFCAWTGKRYRVPRSLRLGKNIRKKGIIYLTKKVKERIRLSVI